jgi:predicted P-loop ATPase
MSATKLSVLDAALDSLRSSIYPVPIKPGSKRPPMEGWQNLRVTVDDLQEHFNNGNNMGWLLGIGPRPILDVDQDCQEALAVAPLISGPKTDRISGHKSNPSSHYFFEVPGECETVKFLDPFRKGKDERKMIVELRGKGCQTIVPPSIHPSGELYEWAKKGDFGKAAYSDVLRWVSKIAAAALLVRYWQARVSGRLALIGMLCRAEWPEEETLEFVSAVIRIADPDDLKEVKANVANCYRRVEGDGEAMGQPTLKEVLGENGKTIVKTITDWLGLNRHSQSGMICSENGNIKPILANAITMLETVPCWNGVLAFNELTMSPVKLKPAPWEERPGTTPWTDHDDTKLAEWFEHHELFVKSSKLAGEAAQAVARENSFHPVRDYLNSLKWDGTARLNTWLPTYLGTLNNDYARAAGRCWLISGVARIYEPGCKVDYVLTLEGEQGTTKSMALNVLAGDEYFLDDFSDFDNKDAKLKMHGAWIVEMAELSVRRAESDKTKAFLTCRDDVFRAPYDRRPQHHPRGNIFAASTNNPTPFTDETGNRRFWPVRCGKIEVEKLRADRDQIWAETVERYRKKEKWWFETPELNELAADEQRDRYQRGQWDGRIEEFLYNSTLNQLSIDDIRNEVIGKQLADWSQTDMNSVARCFKHNGWERTRIRVGDLLRWVYQRTEPDVPSVPGQAEESGNT